MFLAFVVILVLCSALSFPQYNIFSASDKIELKTKKNTKLESRIKDLNLVEQVYDGAQSQINVFDALKRNFENYSGVGEYFLPERTWLVRCEPFCPPETKFDGFRSTDGYKAIQNDDDILFHLNNDKDLFKFLEWTMEQLGSVNSYNASGSYYTGLNVWKKGRREMPLYVEEPKYIVVRREPDDLEQKLNDDDNDDDREFPFIPPRGRKYLPGLENIIAQKDTFIPHRGKRDKLEDIFTYEELFFPLRGKRRMSSFLQGASEGDGLLQGKNKMLKSSDYRTKSTPATSPSTKNDCNDWLTSRCDDILAAMLVAPSPHHHHQQHQKELMTNQAGNMNALVLAVCREILANNANDAIAVDGRRNACALAACQMENDVKINEFDQSVRAQYSKEGAFINNQQRNRQQQQQKQRWRQQQRQRQQRLLSSSSSESVEAGASTFFPLSQSDLLNRLQQYPIRNKQWRDYYVRQMATLSRQFPPF